MTVTAAGTDTLPCSACFGPTDPETGRCLAREYPSCDSGRTLEFSEAEILAAIAADPDFPEITDEDLRNAIAVSGSGRVKRPIYIRLYEEILDYYQSFGPKYQTRINNDLLALVREKKRGRHMSAYTGGAPSVNSRTRIVHGNWHAASENKARRKRGAAA